MADDRILIAAVSATVIGVAVSMAAPFDRAGWSPGVKYDITPLVSLDLPPIQTLREMPPPPPETSTAYDAPLVELPAKPSPAKASPPPKQQTMLKTVVASSRHPFAPPPPAMPIIRVESRTLAPLTLDN
ncbi:MAG: hypothetical protein A3G18_11955 [Rhodospirillales bacterium RIFCSPLOWO2_12_FULL_58_28]|nr:MAG: hypothetical protein A3H92_09040 [Rhodospirillales bacterium RIFCSPLOWO2_02_FULL_58_16]OHC78155.1 MAG: hypothetical protein A3G18_11955 [Rhodospirillales bacterium RIFCSPLOWO2_12_FULL_58_28]